MGQVQKMGIPRRFCKGIVCVFLYALGGNVERIFMQLQSGIKLGGAAKPQGKTGFSQGLMF